MKLASSLILYSTTILASTASLLSEEDESENDIELIYSEVAYLQEEAELQTDLTFSFENDYDEDPNLDVMTTALEVEYGISERLTIGFELPYHRFKETEDHEEHTIKGLGDIEAEVAFNIIEERDDLPAVSVSAGMSLSTGADDITIGTQEWEFGLMLSKQLQKGFFGHAFVSHEFANGIEEDDDEVDEQEFSYGLGFNKEIIDSTWFVFELFGANEKEESQDEEETSQQFYVAPGVLYENDSGLVIGFAIAIGLTDESYSSGGRIKLSYEF